MNSRRTASTIVALTLLLILLLSSMGVLLTAISRDGARRGMISSEVKLKGIASQNADSTRRLRPDCLYYNFEEGASFIIPHAVRACARADGSYALQTTGEVTLTVPKAR